MYMSSYRVCYIPEIKTICFTFSETNAGKLKWELCVDPAGLFNDEMVNLSWPWATN